MKDYNKNNITLKHGDSAERLKELPDASIDSVVTDPPYFVGFMGKSWDKVSSRQDAINKFLPIFKEVFRVLKPGGHLLAFALPRTSHITACLLEDAGFELRDSIHWLFGSGFPKSHNVSKVINKEINNIEKEFECQLLETVKIAENKLKLLPVELNEEKTDFVVTLVETNHGEEVEKRMAIGRVEDLREVTDISLFASTEKICLNIDTLWNSILEEVSHQKKKSITLTKLKTIIELKIWNLLPNQNTQKNIINFTNTNFKRKNYDGIGTALKPSHELIWLARKPLSEATVAEQVLATGTGGLNIDACRVGTEVVSTHSNGKGNTGDKGIYGEFGNIKGGEERTGRFPANLILTCTCEAGFGEVEYLAKDDTQVGKALDTQERGWGYKKIIRNNISDKATAHQPDCVCAELDAQSGIKKGNGHWSKTKTTGFGEYGGGTSEYLGVGEKDTEIAGASRFFYCAKVSTSERNAGLEAEPDKVIEGRDAEQDKRAVPYKKRPTPTKNIHPTVKPLKLMSYLITLITPPGGVVLDPFAGSGSTLVAAKALNFKAVGIEREKEYFKIAKKRIK